MELIDDDPSLPSPASRPSATVAAGRKEDSDQKLWRLLFGLVGVVIALLLLLVASKYFDRMRPETMVPDQTVFSAPFPNSADANVTADGRVRVLLTNQENYPIIITGDANDHAFGDCAGGTLAGVAVADGDLKAPPVTVKMGQAFALEFQCSPKAAGELFSSEVGFAYRSDRSGLARTFMGSVVASVR
jgi:hypothetical protein